MTGNGPRRRLSPAVYRRRRLVALLILLLIVAAVVALVVWQPWRALAGVPAPAPTASASATAAPASPLPEDSTVVPAAPEATDAAATASDSPAEPSGQAIAACSTADISVYAKTDKDAYAAGENPRLSITLVNDGDAACRINVGTTTQKFEITSGDDTWWRSTDCQSAPADQVVQISAGQTVSSVTPLEWDRTRSSVDTCDGDRDPAPAGWYHLQVSIGGIEAADTRVFQLL